MNHDLKGQSVMVTGAAGCIGASAIKQLTDLGARPVVYDLAENRERLHLIMHGADQVAWELGDISDYQRLEQVVKQYDVYAIIHLAALQVPFCKADPVSSARVNVVGTTAIFEVARQHGISRISYASSIASPAMGDNEWLATLYGAHKVCGEQMAAVYWQDWQVPSVGIRPAIIYGPGRDQGMSAAPTIAMLAAFAGQAYTVPFTGAVSYVHVDDAAERFIAGVAKPLEGAHVFDLNGTPADTEAVLQLTRQHFPDAQINVVGDPLPFPAAPGNGELEDFLGLSPCRSIEQGIADTLASFASAQARGVLSQQQIANLIAKNS